MRVRTSSFALKTNLATLKTEVDKLDTYKLVLVPVDLSKLVDVVKNDAVKKAVYDKLVDKLVETSSYLFPKPNIKETRRIRKENSLLKRRKFTELENSRRQWLTNKISINCS